MACVVGLCLVVIDAAFIAWLLDVPRSLALAMVLQSWVACLWLTDADCTSRRGIAGHVLFRAFACALCVAVAWPAAWLLGV